jgi:phosphoribosylformylglycinamidine (FGAM) synthase PurS component
VALAAALVACLLLGVVATGCGPSKATVKITVKDAAGGALANLTVSVGAVTGKTDASGVVTLREIAPGQVTVKISGEGYSEEKGESVKAGDNNLSYSLSPQLGAIRGTDDLQSMRLRISYRHQSGDSSTIEGEVVKAQGAKWRIDDVEVVAIGSVFYIKADKRWQKVEGDLGRMMADAYLNMARMYVTEYENFDAQQLASGITGVTTKWLGREEANGYSCNVFELKWTQSGETFAYKLYVVASGEFARLMTRYTWDRTNGEQLRIDVDNFNKPVELKAPI